MAKVETYIDFSGGDDGTGDGTKGNPYKTIQFSLDNVTRDTTDGNRFNIMDNADHVLTATLDFTTFGFPTTADNAFYLQGYTTDEGDGGRATIDAGGNTLINTTSAVFLVFMDFNVHSLGTAAGMTLGNTNSFINLDIDGGGVLTDDIVRSNSNGIFYNCKIHGQNSSDLTGSSAIHCLNSNRIINCYIEGINRQFAILASVYSIIYGNTIVFNGESGSTSGAGIISFDQTMIMNNIVVNTDSSARQTAIEIQGTHENNVILNNYMEGFSGTGGRGFGVDSGGKVMLVGGNVAYNNTTNFENNGEIYLSMGEDITLTESGLMDVANGDYRPNALLRNLGVIPDLWPGTMPLRQHVGWPRNRLDEYMFAGLHNIGQGVYSQ